jgi:hypothetical protein
MLIRFAIVTTFLLCGAHLAQADTVPFPSTVQLVLDHTQPLAYPRGERLPLYLWPARNPGVWSDAQAETLVRNLDVRGVGLVMSWNAGALEQTLAAGLPVARAQKKLGVPINIDATGPMYSFFDGSPETAHIDDNGQPFFDESFGTKTMGCPFRLEHRIAPMRERMQSFIDAYAKEGLSLGFVFADWEIDGPLEWNHALAASKKCRVCRAHLRDTDDFLAYQDTLRRMRSRLQRMAYAEPVLEAFPEALVTNYAAYPNDGWRYWYDYFERYVPGQPARVEQGARYRHWANEFAETGYTAAMPVVYPWSWTWNWYDFQPGDYRWFYNGLLVASNAGRHTPADVPIVSFVHWHTVDVGRSEVDGAPKDFGEAPQQMSEATYQELLWHMLLRGTDTFFLWCTEAENVKEVELLHPVWAAAQEYGAFLDKGTPVNFEVPSKPGSVVSGLRLGDQVLVRRTDFTDNTEPVNIEVAGRMLAVPRVDGTCQILQISE